MRILFQIQMRRDSTEAFVKECESENEEEESDGLRQLNWIEPGFEWRLVKFVDDKMVATGKMNWTTKKVDWQDCDERNLDPI